MWWGTRCPAISKWSMSFEVLDQFENLTSVWKCVEIEPLSASCLKKEMTKNGSLVTLFNTKVIELIRMDLYSRSQRWSFKEEKLCCVYGGIIMELFFWNFKSTIRHPKQVYTLNSCSVCKKFFLENVLHSSIGETLCFSLITQGRI